MTGEEVFNVMIRDFIEVNEIGRKINPKYPPYIEYFVESGDKKIYRLSELSYYVYRRSFKYS